MYRARGVVVVGVGAALALAFGAIRDPRDRLVSCLPVRNGRGLARLSLYSCGAPRVESTRTGVSLFPGSDKHVVLLFIKTCGEINVAIGIPGPIEHI